MPDNPETALQELRRRIATEGLSKLSAEALRSYKCERWRPPRLARPTASKPLLSLPSACPRKHSDCSARKLIPHSHSGTSNSLRPRSMTTHDLALLDGPPPSRAVDASRGRPSACA
jgi:hypothetical protein